MHLCTLEEAGQGKWELGGTREKGVGPAISKLMLKSDFCTPQSCEDVAPLMQCARNGRWGFLFLAIHSDEILPILVQIRFEAQLQVQHGDSVAYEMLMRPPDKRFLDDSLASFPRVSLLRTIWGRVILGL